MRTTLTLCILCLAAATCLAQPRASVTYAVFQAEAAPYVEVYVTAERRSLVTAEDGRRSVDLLLTLTKVDHPGADSIALADRVLMWSPAGDSINNFMEALRYSVPAGDYTLRIEVIDPQAVSLQGPLSLKLATPLTVPAPGEALHLSDIQLVASRTPATDQSAQSSLVKGGYILEPLAGNLVRRQMSSVSAYVEVYDPTPDLATVALVEHNLAMISDDGEVKDIFRKAKPLADSRSVTPLFVTFNTTPLTSGRYLLTVTLRDKALQALDQRLATFYVANPAADVTLVSAELTPDSWVKDIPEDSLDYVLLSLIPVSGVAETPIIEAAIKSVDENYKQRTILNHFVQMSPTAPARTYREYVDVVRQVDVAFRAGFGRGFQTDRGHIWLKYGQPDDRIEVNNDPSAPPYEIWVYNYVERTQQTPGKFLFYNPTLDNANYILLHSDVRGEIREPRWRRELYSKTLGEFGSDRDGVQGTSVGDNVGRYADQYFTDN